LGLQLDRIGGVVSVEDDEEVDVAVVVAAGDRAVQPDLVRFEGTYEFIDEFGDPVSDATAVPAGSATNALKGC
jgi:hypothetical protein